MRCTAVVALLLLTSAPAADGRQVSIGIGMRDPKQIDAPERPAKTGTARLRGRVVAVDTGAVVRRAQVTISGPEIGSKTAVTDTQGRYEFRDLPAGRVNLSVSKSGFLDTKYGQSQPTERGRSIELAHGQVMDKVDVTLMRGGAISGRILDEFGDPVPDATVAAVRFRNAAGKGRSMQTGRTSITSDLGTFRLFGLPPGEYYVTATARSLDSMAAIPAGGATGSNNTGFAPTYYPGTPNQADAQRVALTIGQEVSIDVQMTPVRLSRIAGSAVTSDGKPMSRAMVMLVPRPMETDVMGMMAGGTETDTNGEFTISGVAPGDYIVQVQSLAALMSAAAEAMAVLAAEGTSAPAATPANPEVAIAKVTVAGDDIAGLVITASRGAKASGRVLFEHGPKPQQLTAVRLMAQTSDLQNIHLESSPPLASLKENGTFEIEGLFGNRVFQLMNLPDGWFLKRIAHRGDDITENGYEFKPGEDVEGFEITLTTRSQTVTGVVTDDKGAAVKEYDVIIFPDDPDKWTGNQTRSYGWTQADEKGQFKFNELPPGSYFAIAVERDSESDWTDPEWLRGASKRATKFTLDEGGAKRLELKLSGS